MPLKPCFNFWSALNWSREARCTSPPTESFRVSRSSATQSPTRNTRAGWGSPRAAPRAAATLRDRQRTSSQPPRLLLYVKSHTQLCRAGATVCMEQATAHYSGRFMPAALKPLWAGILESYLSWRISEKNQKTLKNPRCLWFSETADLSVACCFSAGWSGWLSPWEEKAAFCISLCCYSELHSQPSKPQ